jgi:hypothetical protein
VLIPAGGWNGSFYGIWNGQNRGIYGIELEFQHIPDICAHHILVLAIRNQYSQPSIASSSSHHDDQQDYQRTFLKFAQKSSNKYLTSILDC